MKQGWLALLAMAMAAATPAGAHHSFAADYFEDQTVSIAGEVVEFEYRNPHSWVYLMVAHADERPQRFAAEWASVGRLTRDGILKDTLKKGDRVIISGSPGRNAADRRVHLKAIERPADGWSWRRR